jgi:hypothetical protein
MNEQDILTQVHTLVEQENTLRDQLRDGTIDVETEHAKLKQLEEALDQCWDLLRQRRARREYGESAEGAAARPVSEVEGYLQ